MDNVPYFRSIYLNLKGALCSFGEEEKDLYWLILFMPKQTKHTNCVCFHD